MIDILKNMQEITCTFHTPRTRDCSLFCNHGWSLVHRKYLATTALVLLHALNSEKRCAILDLVQRGVSFWDAWGVNLTKSLENLTSKLVCSPIAYYTPKVVILFK